MYFKQSTKNAFKKVFALFTILSFVVGPSAPYLGSMVAHAAGEPTLSTTGVTNIAQTTATLNATVTDQGSAPVIGRGFDYGETTDYGTPVEDYTGTIGDTNDYHIDISGLTCGTTYHYRARAINNSLVTGYSADDSFGTLPCDGDGGGGGGEESTPPTVVTGGATNIEQTSADLEGSIPDTGTVSIDQVGITYDTSSHASYDDYPYAVHTENSSDTDYTLSAPGLTCGTLYYYRAYAHYDSAAYAVGDEETFTTADCADADLVSHWTLDEASGTRFDSVGDNDLADHDDDTAQASGQVGSAASFNSADQNYLSIPDNDSLRTGGETSFTISLWAKLDAKTGTQVFVSKYGGGNGYAVYYEAGSDRFKFSTYDGTGYAVDADQLGSPDIGTWYHIVAVHDAVENTNTITVNDTNTDSISDVPEYDGDTAPFVIGAFGDGSLYSANASIDDVYFSKHSYEEDTPDSPFAGGDGQGGSPYQINSCAALAAVNDHLGDHFVVTEDLDCTDAGNSAMIGNDTMGGGFSGAFDGGGHTITVALNDEDSNMALFRYVSSGTIHDLRVAGTVAGVNNIAGVVAYANSATIYRVVNSAAVLASGGSAGGLASELDDSTVHDVYSDGTVEQQGYSGWLGGLIGYLSGGTLENAYSVGTVSGHSYNVGGLVGTFNGSISHSFAASPITATGINVGGFAGYASGALSYNYWDTTISGKSACAYDDNGEINASCFGISDSDHFKNNSVNTPFHLEDTPYWDFDDVWLTTSGYPVLQAVPIPDDEGSSVSITSPADQTVVLSSDFEPEVDWGSAAVCEYAYGDDDFTEVNCSNNGSDIPAPTESDFSTVILHVRGDSTEEDSASFFYYPTVQGDTPEDGDFQWTYQPGWTGGTMIHSTISADGLRVVGATDGGKIYTSTDHGVTWTLRSSAGDHSWNSVAGSATGQYVLASAYNGSTFFSDDYGATWNALDGDGQPGSQISGAYVAMSADGKLMMIAGGGYNLYVSEDYGATWTERPVGITSWYNLAMSATGQYVLTLDGGALKSSDDYGVTWETVSGRPSGNFVALALSADGTTIAIGGWHGDFYTSRDFGANWTDHTDLGDRFWYNAAMSADGSVIATGVNYDFDTNVGPAYVSTDGGATFVQQSTPSNGNWQTFGVSADGTRMVNAQNAGVYSVFGPVGTEDTGGGDDGGDEGDIMYDGGDGQVETPYIINGDAANACLQLEGIGQDDAHLGAHYRITNYINCQDTGNSEGDAQLYNGGHGFTPIGTVDHPFSGSITADNGEGGAYDISNMTIHRGDTDNVGVFGFVNGATIEHLYVTGTVEGNNNVGLVVGHAVNSTVDHVTTGGGNTISGVDRVGGLIGNAEQTHVGNTSFSGYVSGGSNVGGSIGSFVGDTGDGIIDFYTIDNSFTDAFISEGDGDNFGFGGLVGTAEYTTINNAVVRDEGPVAINAPHSVYVGGLVGDLEHSAVGGETYALANVTGKGSVGGLLGYANDVVVNGVYSSGSVSGGDDDTPITNDSNSFGGFIGQAEDDLTVDHSYSDSSVSVYASNGEIDGVGGFIGEICSDGSSCHVSDSYATGTVDVFDLADADHRVDTNMVGGFAGFVLGGGLNDFVHNYAIGSVTIHTSETGGQSIRAIGGMYGVIQSASVGQSFANGTVTVDTKEGSDVGGFAGQVINAFISDSYSWGDVVTTDEDEGVSSIGGFAGNLLGTGIARSYSSGAMVLNGQEGSFSHVGGLVGLFDNDDTSEAVITDSFSTTIVPSYPGENLGGFMGSYHGLPNFQSFANNYYLHDDDSSNTVCVGNDDDQRASITDEGGVRCNDISDSTYFTVTSNEPLASWDFADEPVWDEDGDDYPTLHFVAEDVTSVSTSPDAEVAQTSAQIHGTVNHIANGEQYIVYGSQYRLHGDDGGFSEPAFTYPDGYVQEGDFTLVMDGLTCNTSYDYRVLIATEGPWVYGGIQTLTTAPCDGGDEDTTTQSPVLYSPVSGHTYGDANPLDISFMLPEDMLSNSLGLVFTPTDGTEGDPIVLHLRDADSERTNTFQLTPNHFGEVEEILSSSGDSIPDGIYTVALSYQDSHGNPQAVAVATHVVIAPSTVVHSSGGGGRSGGSIHSVQPSGDNAGCQPGYKFSATTGKPCSGIIPSTPPGTAVFQFTQRMERGTRDGQVKMLQTFLTKLGFAPGPIDGAFGTKTEAAVKKWQETHVSEILAPLHRTTGTGIFATLSATAANSILKTGTVTLP